MPGSAGFFISRWRGEVPMSTLFWRDMVLLGTLVNLLATGLALAIAASGGNIAWAAVVHFAPMPGNLFLVAMVWRLPARTPHRWAALVWLVFVTLV